MIFCRAAQDFGLIKDVVYPVLRKIGFALNNIKKHYVNGDHTSWIPYTTKLAIDQEEFAATTPATNAS